jgi:hypothetical protein
MPEGEQEFRFSWLFVNDPSDGVGRSPYGVFQGADRISAAHGACGFRNAQVSPRIAADSALTAP